MRHKTGILAVLSLFLITACASVEEPKPDPIKEELTILQKQLLELQKLQNETKAKLDESTATIDALTMKIQTLEQRQGVQRVSHPQMESKAVTPTSDKKAAPTKKKPAKKAKKKVRRQQ